MNRIDLTTKSAAIGIVLLLDVLFFGVAIGLSLHVGTKELAEKVWAVFAGTNGGLYLILNADAKRNDAAHDSAPRNPTEK